MLTDLHTHSDQSDGSYSPEELVEYALKQDVATIALCDHDTTSGLRRFTAHGRKCNVGTIPGVEISAEWPKGNCHILGLWVSDNYEPLEQALQKIRDSRDGRNAQIIKKLNELGVGITIEEAQKFAGGDVLGRPHIARAMMERGFVQSVQEAFDTYLAKEQAAYVERYRLLPRDAIPLLKQAGATVILAHPTQLKLPPNDVETLIASLIPMGLDGIEVYTPYSDDEEVWRYSEIAKNYGLRITGGSDFHGVSKPDHKLGYFRESTPIPALIGF